jgi:hypothetical protein
MLISGAESAVLIAAFRPEGPFGNFNMFGIGNLGTAAILGGATFVGYQMLKQMYFAKQSTNKVPINASKSAAQVSAPSSSYRAAMS